MQCMSSRLRGNDEFSVFVKARLTFCDSLLRGNDDMSLLPRIAAMHATFAVDRKVRQP